MVKMPLEDFVEEIKSEIIGYEELGEEKALEWEKKFLSLVNRGNKSKPKIEVKNGKNLYLLEDESEIFKIVDMYLAAVDSDEEKDYWEKWD
jgi:propanediol dehydratase large subunit